MLSSVGMVGDGGVARDQRKDWSKRRVEIRVDDVDAQRKRASEKEYEKKQRADSGL
jgi:hypothetical protein